MEKSHINFEQVAEKFLELERTYSLFETTENKIYVWKLIRFSVFREIIMDKQKLKQIHLKTSTFRKYRNLLHMIYNSIFRNPILKRKRKNNIIFDHPRKIILNKFLVDPYTHHFIGSKNKDEYELIERRYAGRFTRSIHSTRSSIDFFNIVNIINKLVLKIDISRTTKDKLLAVEDEIASLFSIEIDIIGQARKRLKNFSSLYQIFSYYLKKKKPKKLYLVASYGLEPYIAAAQDQGVKVIEFQHGVMGPYHLGYHFPNVANVPYFPDEIKLFGSFWDETTSLPKDVEKTYYGHPYLEENISKYDDKIENKNKKQILVISQGNIGNSLSEFILKLARELPHYQFKYKLHPGEFGRWRKEYPKLVELSNLSNVEILENEKELFDLFSTSKFVLGVSSTAIFEAIAFKVEPMIIKLPSYEYMNDLHEIYNVPMFNDIEDIKNYLLNYYENRTDLNVDIKSIFHGLDN